METVKKEKQKKRHEVPLRHKSNLSIEEAVAYTGIRECKLRDMTSRKDCPFVL